MKHREQASGALVGGFFVLLLLLSSSVFTVPAGAREIKVDDSLSDEFNFRNRTLEVGQQDIYYIHLNYRENIFDLTSPPEAIYYFINVTSGGSMTFHFIQGHTNDTRKAIEGYSTQENISRFWDFYNCSSDEDDDEYTIVITAYGEAGENISYDLFLYIPETEGKPWLKWILGSTAALFLVVAVPIVIRQYRNTPRYKRILRLMRFSPFDATVMARMQKQERKKVEASTVPAMLSKKKYATRITRDPASCPSCKNKVGVVGNRYLVQGVRFVILNPRAAAIGNYQMLKKRNLVLYCEACGAVLASTT